MDEDSRGHRLAELAELVGGWIEGGVEGDEELRITGLRGLEDAGPGELSFLTNLRYKEHLGRSRAAAVLVDPELELSGDEQAPALLRVSQPYVAMARIQQLLSPPERPAAGVHPAAFVDPAATLAGGVSVGPGAVVEAGAAIGEGSIVEALAHVGARARIGRDCRICSQVSVREDCVIGDRVTLHGGVIVGADGYGYAFDGEAHQKIPQVGNVVIEDDVEIGAGSCVDRATFGSTVIGAGTKIDNLVQVGHNVQVGRGVLLVAQVGIAGSSSIGDGAALGGQVGVAGHRRIGAGARVAAKSGVTGNIPDGAEVAGFPAVPRTEWLRSSAMIRRLGDLRRELQSLRRQVAGARTEMKKETGDE